MFPQFLKWNVSILLAKTHGLDLTSASQFEVREYRLVSQPYEKVRIAGEEFDGGKTLMLMKIEKWVEKTIAMAVIFWW
ncbi:hypothetical protein CsSME_00046978 [Camellia sinensis var. sinensis]